MTTADGRAVFADDDITALDPVEQVMALACRLVDHAAHGTRLISVDLNEHAASRIMLTGMLAILTRWVAVDVRDKDAER